MHLRRRNLPVPSPGGRRHSSLVSEIQVTLWPHDTPRNVTADALRREAESRDDRRQRMRLGKHSRIRRTERRLGLQFIVYIVYSFVHFSGKIGAILSFTLGARWADCTRKYYASGS